MKSASNKHLHRKLLCAIFAGALAAPFAAPHAYALPIEGANAAANKTEADISTSGTVMDITGKTDHNVLRWEDFSIEKNEKVRFDGGNQTRDYLNLVTGEGASNIYGTIEGGRNVYLVNPHGILFAKGSQVNTGALYLSTANPADVANAAGASWNGTSPLSASAQMGDVLNLGTVKTSKLYIEGKNVKVLNTDAVTDTNGTALTGANVTIRSEDAPHIGYDVANTTTRNFTVNGVTSSKTVSDYASTNVAHHAASAKSRGWDVKKLNGTDAHTDYDYMRVHNVYELQHMDANRVNAAVTGSDKKIIGRYMLANDIAASETQDWDGGFQPIGSSDNSMGAFTGRFDGVGHTITGLTIKAPTDSFGGYSRGMFAYIEHAIVENVSLKGASVSGEKDVGGIVGAADYSCVVRNVSFSGKVYGSGTVVGGIVGTLQRSTLENAYHEGTVEGDKAVGGIVGYMIQNSTVQNVRNAGKVIGNEMLGGIAGSVELGSSVRNALQTGDVEQRSGQTDSQVGGVVGLLDGSTLSHAVWKEGSATNGSGALIQNGIGKNQGNTTVDDVQEHSLDDMKKAATYAKWGSDVATEGGKRTPWRIYDGKTMPLLKAFLRTKHLANRESVYDGTAPTIAGGDGITWTAGKDAGTYHAYSEQYDIVGGAYTVKPKELTLNFKSGTRFDKTYDGNANVT
ncbi:filamentous hemagglutinin N-terminal domain-containing protein, partial [uncultured Selenomonas sp.]|uniref:two-partner secretion domain-containing protein n=1 Tax=uncultured Selenomonas sp. TaxID=159275 RepID=UPI0028D0E1EE